jgi:hypothetical protein
VRPQVRRRIHSASGAVRFPRHGGAGRPCGRVAPTRHASPRQPCQARAVPVLHAHCLLQMSTDGQDRTSPRSLFDKCRGWATM